MLFYQFMNSCSQILSCIIVVEELWYLWSDAEPITTHSETGTFLSFFQLSSFALNLESLMLWASSEYGRQEMKNEWPGPACWIVRFIFGFSLNSPAFATPRNSKNKYILDIGKYVALIKSK